MGRYTFHRAAGHGAFLLWNVDLFRADQIQQLCRCRLWRRPEQTSGSRPQRNASGSGHRCDGDEGSIDGPWPNAQSVGGRAIRMVHQHRRDRCGHQIRSGEQRRWEDLPLGPDHEHAYPDADAHRGTRRSLYADHCWSQRIRLRHQQRDSVRDGTINLMLIRILIALAVAALPALPSVSLTLSPNVEIGVAGGEVIFEGTFSVDSTDSYTFFN